jgi:hypothetical protein
MPLCLIQVSENFYRPSASREFFNALTPMIVLDSSPLRGRWPAEERIARLLHIL